MFIVEDIICWLDAIVLNVISTGKAVDDSINSIYIFLFHFVKNPYSNVCKNCPHNE